jgi:hypothetical protein
VCRICSVMFDIKCSIYNDYTNCCNATGPIPQRLATKMANGVQYDTDARNAFSRKKTSFCRIVRFSDSQHLRNYVSATCMTKATYDISTTDGDKVLPCSKQPFL